MAWVKVGQLQKGKIFTVYSGETFDLKWYSDNINWENPVVIGQVSSIYFDRLYTAGFKANIIHQGGTVYKAECLSNGIANGGINFIDWLNAVNVPQGANPYVDGGGVLNNGDRHSKGVVPNFRGMGIVYYIPGNYDYYTSSGDVVVRVGSTEVYRRNIIRGNRSLTSWLYTPLLSGEVVVSYENSNTNPIYYNFKYFYSNWEVKSGILTIYANESFGVNY